VFLAGRLRDREGRGARRQVLGRSREGDEAPSTRSGPGYENNLQFVLRRYCGLWGRGT